MLKFSGKLELELELVLLGLVGIGLELLSPESGTWSIGSCFIIAFSPELVASCMMP